jgi:hypothetical protein
MILAEEVIGVVLAEEVLIVVLASMMSSSDFVATRSKPRGVPIYSSCLVRLSLAGRGFARLGEVDNREVKWDLCKVG